MAPDNGMINCLLGNDGLPTNRDTCTFSCNPGFVLNIKPKRRCRVRRGVATWNRKDATCTPGKYNYIAKVIVRNHSNCK